MDPELLTLDELPREAREAIEEAEADIQQLRNEANRQAIEIRARAERVASELEVRATEAVRQRQLELYRTLRPIQDRYAREGRLDEALAIRDRIRSLRASLLQALPDPGSLAYVREPQVGSTMLFDVVGSSDGVVWGTDVYTADSTLAAAAVHAGVLAEGQRGLVRVTFVDALNIEFIGSLRNGVSSQDYPSWPTGYRIDRA